MEGGTEDGAKIAEFFISQFFKTHILDTVNFYAPRCIDKVFGGYINCFLDDGTICDYETKQLVGQARFVFIFSVASLLKPDQGYRKLAEHGIYPSLSLVQLPYTCFLYCFCYSFYWFFIRLSSSSCCAVF